MQLPIIRLEVEGMRRTISAALAEHAVQMDEDIRQAVDEYCTPENLRMVVKNAAWVHLQAAIKEEVKAFFSYGDGRKAVAAAVKESIRDRARRPSTAFTDIFIRTISGIIRICFICPCASIQTKSTLRTDFRIFSSISATLKWDFAKFRSSGCFPVSDSSSGVIFLSCFIF